MALSTLVACGEQQEEPVAERARAAPAAEPEAEEEARCGADEAYAGGDILETPDGAQLYYRVAGPADAPVLLFLHGGPGGNTFGAENSAGPHLERALRVVYVDQRGCGRSAGGPSGLALGMDPTVADLERLRAHLEIERWSVAAHSWGGMIAAVYATRHVDAIDKIVMIEATADLGAALENQVSALAADDANVAAIAHNGRPALDRFIAMVEMVGLTAAQRRLHWTSDEAQRAGERWDRQSRLGDCTREGVLPSFRASGWTDSHPELMSPLGRPTMLIAGRESRVLGTELADRTARAWGAELVWMEGSAHYPHLEEPEAFAAHVTRFVRGQ